MNFRRVLAAATQPTIMNPARVVARGKLAEDSY